MGDLVKISANQPETRPAPYTPSDTPQRKEGKKMKRKSMLILDTIILMSIVAGAVIAVTTDLGFNWISTRDDSIVERVAPDVVVITDEPDLITAVVDWEGNMYLDQPQDLISVTVTNTNPEMFKITAMDVRLELFNGMTEDIITRSLNSGELGGGLLQLATYTVNRPSVIEPTDFVPSMSGTFSLRLIVNNIVWEAY